MDNALDEIKRHFDVVAEGVRSDVRQVAEGHQLLRDGQFRIIDRIDRLENELGAMIRLSYSQLEQRITSLEVGLAAVKARVDKLDFHH